MAIAARIVTEHGGWITAANHAEKGAEVVIRLPRERSSDQRAPGAGEME
jgi:signal transduction histidine kinase